MDFFTCPILRRLQSASGLLLCIFFFSIMTPHVFGQNGEKTGNNTVIWQLNLKNNHPSGYSLQFAKITGDDKGRPCIEADSRRDNTTWHSCILLPGGLFKAGQDYVVSIDYEVIDRVGQGSYFYVFARSGSLGYGADYWQRWYGEAEDHGTAKLRFSPSANDYQLTVGICKQGAIRILNLKIIHGDGLTSIPLATTAGGDQQPPQITGAQPFTIDPPSNPNGPVVNAADFGLVADGNAPPANGPDRNSIALKAAIAKCRETGASKLVVPKGIYRITSGQTIVFDGLNDFVFDGGGSTFLYHQIKGGHGISIQKCSRGVFRNFNLDWDWKIDPLASIGRITKLAADQSFFEMRFEGAVPMDPKRWVTMNPLDEKLRAPGTGTEFGGFTPKKIDRLNTQTVRVWPSRPIAPIVGRLYVLRHYTYEKHGITMSSNTHLSLQNVTIFSFPGIGFIVGGDQHHFELVHCRITYPDNERRAITTTADGLHVAQSQGFIRLQDCDFGYMGDDCVNIHDNIHSGVRVVDAHTLVATGIVAWQCPYSAGDPVEIRNGDYSPTGFTGKLTSAKADYKNKETTLVFEAALPAHIASDAILFNHRYGSHNVIIKNCTFHENRARGVLCNTADWLIEGNRFYHNQHAGLHLITDVSPGLWSEGFGARNVIIRNNKFDSLNVAGAGGGAAIYVGAEIAGSPSHYPLLENILLENNFFKEVSGPVIDASSFKNLVIRNNVFINSLPSPIVLKMRGCILATFGNGLWVEGNDWMTKNGLDPPAFFYDGENTKNIVCRGNLLKN
ncbi:MAG TPA: right-handed parallel beta-helix repeat-containing protein [Mucilaginibacter sp.]|nr:right-handed parallel beta-helix repeat-containing protein [Mucilaginibacter sp.]